MVPIGTGGLFMAKLTHDTTYSRMVDDLLASDAADTIYVVYQDEKYLGVFTDIDTLPQTDNVAVYEVDKVNQKSERIW